MWRLCDLHVECKNVCDVTCEFPFWSRLCDKPKDCCRFSPFDGLIKLLFFFVVASIPSRHSIGVRSHYGMFCWKDKQSVPGLKEIHFVLFWQAAFVCNGLFWNSLPPVNPSDNSLLVWNPKVRAYCRMNIGSPLHRTLSHLYFVHSRTPDFCSPYMAVGDKSNSYILSSCTIYEVFLAVEV